MTRDDLIWRVVEVLDREDPGGRPTIVAAAIVAAIWPDILTELERAKRSIT